MSGMSWRNKTAVMLNVTLAVVQHALSVAGSQMAGGGVRVDVPVARSARVGAANEPRERSENCRSRREETERGFERESV